MLKRLMAILVVLSIALVISAPTMLYAGADIPKTPITQVLGYKTGLNLTDSQIKKLTVINNSIIDKMIQVKSRAQLCKKNVDEYTANWARIQTDPSLQNKIKEYYQCLAELKTLELEAINMAKQVLTQDQLRKYVDLASLESLMLKLEPDLVSVY